jgi:hypothetical protein
MRAVRFGLRAKARRRHAVAPAEHAREVRRLAVAHQPRHVAHGDRRLLGQQLRGHPHAPRLQVLLETRLAELRVGALQLARRARHGASHTAERQRLAVVARDDHPREQVEPATAGQRVRAHTPCSDCASPRGTRRAQAQRRAIRSAACA